MLDGGQVKLRPQPILPSIFLHEPAYLQSSWQLDGLYTLSFILSLDLGILSAAPFWCTRGASWAHLGRILAEKMAFQENLKVLILIGFSCFFEPQARPTSD